NLKRPCDLCHDSINTKEKYEKLLLKMKQTINSQHQDIPTSESTASNESSTITSNNTSATISNETNTESPAVNGYVSSPDVILKPNDDSQTSASKATSSNETNLEPAAVNGYVSSPDVALTPDDNKSLDNVQFQHFVEIKNDICGDIKYILKQTEFASKLVALAFDETVSVKNFLVEITSAFMKIKESINDLLMLCNETLENIPSAPTTIEKIQSTEKLISRDPSIIKVFDEDELRYLVNQGPYQPLLPRYPVNTQLKKKNTTCHFVPQWYKEFPLMEYSPITDSIYCFCCRLFGRGPGSAQSENTWVSTGMKMWNKVKGFQI
ncbi:unnamed protein product, partial [Rotaria sp. Silwood2]